MRTTIDSAGRLVVPKSLREVAGLTAGAAVDIVLTDGRIEIELAPTDAHVDTSTALPRIVVEDATPLTDDDVRRAVETARR